MALTLGLGKVGNLGLASAEKPHHSVSNLLLRDNSSNLLLRNGVDALGLGHQ